MKKIFQPFKSVRSFAHSTVQNHSFKLVRSSFNRSSFVRFVRSFNSFDPYTRICVRYALICVRMYVPIKMRLNAAGELRIVRSSWLDRQEERQPERWNGKNTASRERAKKFHIKNALLCACNAVFRKKLKKITYPALKTLAYSNNITNFAIETRQ